MRVKVLLNLGSIEFGGNTLNEGEHEIDEKFGKRLVSLGLAVELPPAEPTRVQAVPPTDLKTSEPAAKPKGNKKTLD